MKKQFFACAALVALILSGCGAQQDEQKEQQADTVVTRVASLKGPTSMGLADLMTRENPNYEFSMHVSADEIVPLIVKDEIDIALIPANLAATLYQKTEGQIEVLNINTLGVLEVVASDEISNLSELKGKTVYMTGKGTTPEASLRYLLEQNNVPWGDVKIEFKTEPTEVVSALKADNNAIAVLPQPFATVATQQLDNKKIVLSLGEEWNRATEGKSQLVTGVTIARKEFIEEHSQAINQFQKDAESSVEFVNKNIDDAAKKIDSLGIVKESIAKLAIPRCNLVHVTGEEMKTALDGYLETLYQYDTNLVGGKLPDDNFYDT